MRTPDQFSTSAPKIPTTHADRASGGTPGIDGPPALRRRVIALATILVTFVGVATGAGVFAWQHGQVSDRQQALSVALQERDAARQQVSALGTKVEALTGRADALHAEVGQLRDKVGQMRSQLTDLKEQLAVPAPAPCDPAAFLAVIRQQVDAAGTWASVDIQECSNGYARVYAHLRGMPGEAEQVFLRDVDGSWQVITSGTGISCSDQDISAELKAACEALGLS